MKECAAARTVRRQRGLSLIEIMIALVVVGAGIGLFVNLQRNSGSRQSGNNKMMLAGQLVEKDIEAVRIHVAMDTTANWPPHDTAFVEGRLKLVRKISGAVSPKTGANLANVRKLDIIVSWGSGALDSMNITTYVARRF
jgi:prepilin-type N-terminal cleavage/methylation domain-containing protein